MGGLAFCGRWWAAEIIARVGPGGEPVLGRHAPPRAGSIGAEAPRAWQEWRRGDLPVELPAPAAGDGRAARRTRPIGPDRIRADQIAVALDQERRTVVAMRVLERSHAARDVPRVDVAEACVS